MSQKFSLIAIALIMFGLQTYAQDSYTVTRINGKVINYKTGTELKAGDILQSSDKVTFDSFDSYIISISQNTGRYMMKMHLPPSPEAVQQLTVTVKEVAVPTKRRSLMAERYKPEEKEVADLKGYFGNDKFSVIGDKVSIPVSAGNYQIDENKFIVADSLRKSVAYRNFNLLDPFKFKKPFHCIFCRNVMIYFDVPTKNAIINKFYDALEPGGYFMIGHSESLSSCEHKFKYIKPSIYQKV